MKGFRFLVIGLGIFLVLISQDAWAQEFDYKQYPRLDFSFGELQLNLEVNPEEGSIEGTARYNAISNIDNIDSLVLQAAHMEIREVRVNDSEVDFNLRNDSLIIAFEEPYGAGESLEVSVNYKTIPRFGVLQNDLGTMWSSLLPLSNRHWFPSLDHPRVTFKLGVSLTVPSGYQAVANGVKVDEEILDLNRVRFQYQTRSQVPATAVAFAVGKFDRQETSFGIKRITLNSEKGALTEVQNQELLEEAYDLLRLSEQRLGMEFPYERLHIVVLKDHFWETKTWGASTVFLYKNGGDFLAQLRRAIYAQWFGVYQREEQWSDSEATTLLQAALDVELSDTLRTLTGKDYPDAETNDLYQAFGSEKWNRFRRQFNELDNRIRNTVMQNLSDLVGVGEGVYSFRRYGEFWYQKNGQPVFELEFDKQQAAEEFESDSVIYRVNYAEEGNNLRLTFNAQKGVYNELVTLPLVQISPDRVDTLEVTFTGARDSVRIQVPSLVQNVKILDATRPNLTLDQYKPASYLIYQLRNDENIEDRAEAARKLGHHSDDPDLQLAIKDFMSQELDPRIRAPLLASFGDITGGASGTEQVFLDALGSNNIGIQKAGLFVLQNYPDNEQVQQAVRQYATGVDSLPLYKDAARVFFSLADSVAMNGFVSEVVSSDTAGYKAIFAIQELANAGNVERALKQGAFYISDVYDYAVRSKALQILFQHDRSPESWEARAPELLADVDPRIRYLTVEGLSRIPDIDRDDLFSVIIQDEYDQRVYRAMSRALNL